MKHLFVRVVSPSYDAWRKVIDSAADSLRAHGIIDWSIYRDTANPNAALVDFRTEDVAGAKAFFQTAEFKQLNAAANVTEREFYVAE